MDTEKRSGFAIGDVVHLKAGGPAMTVTHTEKDWCLCGWFTAEGELHQVEFPADALQLPPEEVKEPDATLTRAGFR